MKQVKRVAILLLILCLLAAILPTTAFAYSPWYIDGGTCGENVYWDLTYDGSLIIYGTGPMYDWDRFTSYRVPWWDYVYEIKSISIVDKVTHIGAWAFYGCTVESIIWGEHITSIGDYAFLNCHNLTGVTIPNSVTIIGGSAFSGCENLKSVEFGNRVATIGVEAFQYCSGLTGIKLPDSVFSLGEHAFSFCSGLTYVELGKNTTTIGNYAFYECGNIKSIYYRGTEADAYDISYGNFNDPIENAVWHYEVKELTGGKPAYYCGKCQKCYWLDGSESHFTDVLTNNWQFSFAKYAVEQNLMAGTGTDAYGRVTFLPDKSISREEFAQVLYNATGKPAVSIANKFPDVANNGWYRNAVLWANEYNIASGMGNGRFGVGKNITRQDLALMLYKYAALRGCSLDASSGVIFQYADGTMVSGYAQKAMDWAVTNGILSGKGTAGKPIYTFRLDPAGTATRAECAAMLKNFMVAFRVCPHKNLQATADVPATCTEAGNIAYWHCDGCGGYFSDGEATAEILLEDTVLEATGHSWADATCTEPKTCTQCGKTTGFEAGHSWKYATCTEPKTCTVCCETEGSPLGHYMVFTECVRKGYNCDYVDFSCIAGTYTNVGGYIVPVGTTTMLDLEASDVSVSNSGEFSFTYNGQSYTLTLKQNNDKSTSSMAYFDCYLNGELVENLDFRAGSEAYDNRIYLDGFIADNCKIYLMATP